MQDEKEHNLPEPTARMPAWGGLMMAQNCLMPKGPPKFDTVNVPPCEEYMIRIDLINHYCLSGNL